MTRWSAHLSMLFRELPLEQRPAAAHRAGFDVVECWWPPLEVADAFALELRRYGFEVACLNCFGGDIEAGERGFLNIPGRYERTMADFSSAAVYAGLIGASAINVLVGRALPDVPLERQLDVVSSTLRDIAAEAATAGLTVLVEPLSRHDVPETLLPDAASAVALIGAVGSDSVALLYDAFHAAAAGRDPVLEAPALVDLIGHVQYAAFPGRGAPGPGAVDPNELAEALGRAGYRGAIGLEFHPDGPTPALAEIVGPYDRAMGGRA